MIKKSKIKNPAPEGRGSLNKVERQKSKLLKTGFTIIELLVVIAIISMIGSLIFVQTQSARSRARDAEREEEVKTLQNALALYAVNNKNYPLYSGPLTGSDAASLELINKESLSRVPFDPINTGNYIYVYNSADGTSYVITYYLETESITGKSAGMQQATP